MKKSLLVFAALMVGTFAKAQTNAQILYDFGSDRKYVTLTLEMFKADKWGSTYFFVDHDFNYDKMDTNSPNVAQNVPMQFTAVWGCKDIFGVKGLNFSGFADFWWEDHVSMLDKHGNVKEFLKDNDGNLIKDKDDNLIAKTTAEHTIFTTEPQLWYNVGQHFGCENLSVGGEVEISHNFGSNAGWMVRPCLGVKWDF